jgi:ABC-2 type transport system ATP-binding protein
VKLVVENITKSYGTLNAVEGVSFSVPKGEVVGFLGPNGAGKSTTMKIITGVMPPTSGKVLLDGIDGFKNPMEYKRKIGYLPELPPLYPDMVVCDYLRFAAQIREVKSNLINEAIDKVVNFASLEKVKDRIIGHLSKGFRQRVGIAQALIHDPDVLIMDEPTVGLDPVQIVEIRGLIKKLAEDRTIILSTHILPEVSAICKKIIIITNGRIVGNGTEEELWKTIPEASDMRISLKGDLQLIKRILSSVNTIEKYSLTSTKDDLKTFTINGKEDADPRIELTTLLGKAGIQVYEMKPPGRTLEEVFVHLTTRDNTETAFSKGIDNSDKEADSSKLKKAVFR